jgi:hypothetical protein
VTNVTTLFCPLLTYLNSLPLPLFRTLALSSLALSFSALSLSRSQLSRSLALLPLPPSPGVCIGHVSFAMSVDGEHLGARGF